MTTALVINKRSSFMGKRLEIVATEPGIRFPSQARTSSRQPAV